MSVDPGEFAVWQFFLDGEQELVLNRVSAECAVMQAKRLTESVGGRLGTTCRVIITDGGDYICFEWKHGVGVTFPPPVAASQNAAS